MSRRNALVVLAVALHTGGCTPTRPRVRPDLAPQIEARARQVPSLAGDPFFLAAVEAERGIARERFVPGALRRVANLAAPLPIGWGQTISDPYIVAVMTAAAQVSKTTRVLEVGTGSGYQAAILSRLGARVASVEIVPQLARRAAATLKRLGFHDIALKLGDGFEGWRGRAPYDAIIVTAGIDRIPAPLMAQLAAGGRLVIPLGAATDRERLVVVRKPSDGSLTMCALGPASFVPFTGFGKRTATSSAPASPTMPLCFGREVV